MSCVLHAATAAAEHIANLIISPINTPTTANNNKEAYGYPVNIK